MDSPVVNANPEVIEVPVSLFLLLVPFFFLLQFLFCFQQQFQATRGQQHMGDLQGASMLILIVRELM